MICQCGRVLQAPPTKNLHKRKEGGGGEEGGAGRRSSVSRMTQREIANKLVEQSEAHKPGRRRENVSQIYVYSLGNYIEVCVCVCVLTACELRGVEIQENTRHKKYCWVKHFS